MGTNRKKILTNTALLLLAAIFLAGRVFGEDLIELNSLDEVEKEDKNLLVYDENYIMNLGTHNYHEFFEMVKSHNNATVVILIYARKI